MANIDLSLLAPPEIIESLDFETILADCKAYLISIYPEAEAMLDLESEPMVKTVEVWAYRELLLRSRYNDEARALLLALSKGTDLDHIGITYYDGELRLLVSSGDALAVPPIAEVWEKDDDFRQRLALKPESYSVAGPRDAFKFHGLSASGQVKDIGVTSPTPGTTSIYVLSRSGSGVPDSTIITAVSTRLNGEEIRPLSEEVLVYPATITNYSLNIQLTLYPGASSELAISAAQTALAAYADAHHRLDAEITISAIIAAAHVAGVKRTVVVSPSAEITCDVGHAPYCTGITVTVIGVEA